MNITNLKEKNMVVVKNNANAKRTMPPLDS